MPTDWLDPEAPDPVFLVIDNAGRAVRVDPDDLFCGHCGYLESQHQDAICPTETEVRQMWGDR